MVVRGVEGGASIQNASKSWAVLFLIEKTSLEGDMSHGAMNADGNRRLRWICGEDHHILM
jgi:hypothetical protein